ncbi:hypothetical protein BO99DRAFT_439697 [Aspergillus violaceofuscus CBS 115571]|uniref:Secreted peptide n=1 Tax=Aspergillus violaceofuscus (strain CBS 115571) TaxID=1450538 RepID=A0A2V5HQK6_ASPV1|nr:hypothetical protein BO99DRAFT_439697 [Aspergillus violaceofuscus CBS 115571]
MVSMWLPIWYCTSFVLYLLFTAPAAHQHQHQHQTPHSHCSSIIPPTIRRYQWSDRPSSGPAI